MQEMTIVQNPDFGYYEVQPKPSEEELNDYYAQKYYQREEKAKRNKYQKSYSEEEQTYINNKIRQKYQLVKEEKRGVEKGSMLDIGCGEGHALQFFQEKGWDVLGIDYSSFALDHFYPGLIDHFRQGRNLDLLRELRTEEKIFDLLWMDNVLEHVIDPAGLLALCYELVEEGGLLMVEVPNDFSLFQDFLYKTGRIPRQHWVAPPDHLSYFSAESLEKLANSLGWHTVCLMTDFPIELFLTNPYSNYVKDKSVGKGAHLSRLAVENYLQEHNPPEKINEFYRIMLEIGLGRQLIGVFKKI